MPSFVNGGDFVSNRGVVDPSLSELSHGHPGHVNLEPATNKKRKSRFVPNSKFALRAASEALVAPTVDPTLIDGTELADLIGGQHPIPDCTIYPYRCIAYLRVSVPGQAAYQTATGFLVGRHTVLTAAHVVYPRGRGAGSPGGWAAAIDVVPGLSDFSIPPPFGVYRSTHFACSPAWQNLSIPVDYGLDYGFVLLNEPIGDRLGYFGFTAASDEQLSSTSVRLAGYPVSLPGSGTRNSRQWGCEGRLDHFTSALLYYRFNTMGGQSGSPIYINTSNASLATGIHTTFVGEDDMGVRIGGDVYSNIARWAQYQPAVQ